MNQTECFFNINLLRIIAIGSCLYRLSTSFLVSNICREKSISVYGLNNLNSFEWLLDLGPPLYHLELLERTIWSK